MASLPKGETPQQIAARLLDKNDKNVIAATAEFVRLVRKDEKLFRRIAEPLIDVACYDIVRSVQMSRREIIWNTPQHSIKDTHRRLAGLANITLLDFPLPDGTPLRDALRSNVEGARDFYAKQSTDMASKSIWLSMIVKALPNDKTAVGDVLSDKALRRMQEAATGKPKPHVAKPTLNPNKEMRRGATSSTHKSQHKEI